MDIIMKTIKIKSIVRLGKEETFDLKVYPFNNFLLSNRILTHNSGKSTMTLQMAYFLSWSLAGGKMITEEYEKGKWRVTGMIKPTKAVRFGMENIVFTPEELMKRAEDLYKKYGPNQLIVYDEGKSGLDSENAMKSINKAMGEFFQRCRVYHHIIFIVLPNYFKLHEDYAVARSLFLVDVFADKNYNRGYFNFYNELQKEKLFFFGKRLIGVTARYNSAHESFWGRFTKWIPVNKKEYDNAKMEALKHLNKSRHEQKYKKQRDGAIYLIKKYSDMSSESIAKELSVICNEKIGDRTIRYAVASITHEDMEEIN